MRSGAATVELKNVKLPPRKTWVKLFILAPLKPKWKPTFIYPVRSAPTVRDLTHSDQEERDFVLAGTGHMNCYGKSKYLLTKSPVVVKDEKPSLFETYPAKPPTDYRRENNVNSLKDQPHLHDIGHVNNNLVPHWWWTTQRNRKMDRKFNDWLKF
ncbi:hypothetical protein ACHWQZ_G000812 [Mnemiopsis leidyi]